jgi:methionyl-tRNA formyltransferase
MKKIAFLGYDFFYSCFEVLLENNYEIKWLFTFECDNKVNFNSKIITKANEIGAKVFHTRISKSDIEILKNEGCDLIISAAYPYKIPVISDSPFMINIHPTLLPVGKGPWPMPVVILKGLSESGVTIHKISEEFDSGDILIKKAFTISSNENLESLSCKSQIVAKEILINLLADFISMWKNATPQGEGEYWAMPTFDERTLNWNLPVIQIDRIARAFGKFDSLATFNSKDWVVQDLTVWAEKHNFTPGTLVHATNREVLVAGLDGYVCIRFFSIDPDFKESN